MAATVSLARVAMRAAKSSSPIRLRLMAAHEEALRFLFQDFSGLCGLRSNFGAQMEAMQNPGGSGGGLASYVQMIDAPVMTAAGVDRTAVPCSVFVPERWGVNWDYRVRGGVHRAYRAIVALDKEDPLSAIVLYYLCGPQNRTYEWATFGEVTQIAHLTPKAIALAERANRKLEDRESEGRAAELERARGAISLEVRRLMKEVRRLKRTPLAGGAAAIAALSARARGLQGLAREHDAKPKAAPRFGGAPREKIPVVTPREICHSLVHRQTEWPKDERRAHVDEIRKQAEQLTIGASSGYTRILKGLPR